MTILEMDPPELAALDAKTDAELLADADRECRSSVQTKDGVRVCYFVRGHSGPCSWAVDP